MKDFHDLIINRHSIRRYTSQPLSAESVKLILEAALLAPSSKSSRPWVFVAVDKKEDLLKLSECRPVGTTPLRNCVLAVVVAADSAKSDAWIEDCSIAAAYMQLQAAALGLGSCWVQIRGRFTADDIPSDEPVRELVGLPEEFPIECIITFGYKDEQRKPVDPSKLLWERVSIGKYTPPTDDI